MSRVLNDLPTCPYCGRESVQDVVIMCSEGVHKVTCPGCGIIYKLVVGLVYQYQSKMFDIPDRINTYKKRLRSITPC